MTRAEAASRAGIARSTLERIETGAASVTLANLVAATDAVGLDLVIQTYPGRPIRLRDSGQLAIAQELAAASHVSWKATFEQRAGDHGEAIDLVFWGSGEILAVEVERMALDWQSQYRRASVKRDWLAAHSDRPVRLVVVLSDTRRNRTALMPFVEVIGMSLPAGTSQMLRSIRGGTALGADALCWFRPRTR